MRVGGRYGGVTCAQPWQDAANLSEPLRYAHTNRFCLGRRLLRKLRNRHPHPQCQQEGPTIPSRRSRGARGLSLLNKYSIVGAPHNGCGVLSYQRSRARTTIPPRLSAVAALTAAVHVATAFATRLSPDPRARSTWPGDILEAVLLEPCCLLPFFRTNFISIMISLEFLYGAGTPELQLVCHSDAADATVRE